MFTIRGKRRRRETSDACSKLRRGRPFKRSSQVQKSRHDINMQLRNYQNSMLSQPPRGSQAPSVLELLPNELIQQIFFYCLEVNLPRASLRLATALSQASTYRVLVLFAFFDDDKIHPVESHLFKPAVYRQLALIEKMRLQSSILNCRWCDLNRIRSCLPDLSRLKMVQKWHEENLAEREIKARHGDRPIVSLSNGTTVSYLLPNLNNRGEMDLHFLPRSPIPEGGNGQLSSTVDYCPAILTWSFEIRSGDTGVVTKLPQQRSSILAARVIPDWLLSGATWDRNRLAFIQILRQGFQCIDDDDELVMWISTQALFQGISSAVEGQLVDVLMTLLDLYCTFVRDHAGVRESLPLHLFHIAARQGAKSSELLALLLRASLDSVPHDDSALTAWAIQRQTDDEVARWLLGVMSGTSTFTSVGNGCFFPAHALNDDARAMTVKARKSFALELKYLRGSEYRTPRSLTKLSSD